MKKKKWTFCKRIAFTDSGLEVVDCAAEDDERRLRETGLVVVVEVEQERMKSEEEEECVLLRVEQDLKKRCFNGCCHWKLRLHAFTASISLPSSKLGLGLSFRLQWLPLPASVFWLFYLLSSKLLWVWFGLVRGMPI